MSMISRSYGWLARQAERSEVECRIKELLLLEANPDTELLDVGCADGKFTLKVADKIGTNKIHGIEVVEEDINKARSVGINVRQGNLNQKFPYEDESFNVAIASHVIEHLANTDNFLKEIYRVLKTGGYLVIATPNLAAWPHIALLMFGKQPTIVEVSDEALVGTWSPRGGCVDRAGPAHRRIFTTGALEGLLEYYGFSIERSIGVGYFPLPNSLAKVMSYLDKRHATNIVLKARKGH